MGAWVQLALHRGCPAGCPGTGGPSTHLPHSESSDASVAMGLASVPGGA